MKKQCSIDLIIALTFSMLLGCHGEYATYTESSPAEQSLPPIINGASMLSVPSKHMDHESRQRLLDSENFKILYIGAHKVECEGYQLALCWLHTPEGSTQAEFLHESIEGFYYEWGFDYELLVSQSTDLDHSAQIQEGAVIADRLREQYFLIEVMSQSPYHLGETFDYVAQYGSRSINKVAQGLYQLNQTQHVICDSSVCSAIDSALQQEQAMLLTLQYGTRPDDPLTILELSCVESSMAFVDACLGKR